MIISLTEAAKRLGMPAETLASWVWSGAGPEPVAKRRYTNVQFAADEVERWKRQYAQPVGEMIGIGMSAWPDKPKDRAPRNLLPMSELRRSWRSQLKT